MVDDPDYPAKLLNKGVPAEEILNLIGWLDHAKHNEKRREPSFIAAFLGCAGFAFSVGLLAFSFVEPSLIGVPSQLALAGSFLSTTLSGVTGRPTHSSS